MIKNKKRTGKIISAIFSITAWVMLSASVFASDVIDIDVIETDVIAGADIETFVDGKPVTLNNKPFIENNTVYLPLREMLNIEGITNISYKNGYVEFLIYSEKPIEYRGLEYDFWVNRVQIGSEFAYIAGHSGGTTENAEILRAPILKDGITYAPYDLFDELKESGQGAFENTTVTVKNSAAVLSGILYRNDDLNFKIELPLSWVGKYYTKNYDNRIYFIHSASGNILFSIAVYANDEIKYLLDSYPAPYKIAYTDSRYTYIFHIPSDVQYDAAEENDMIKAEYKEMASAVDFSDNDFIIDSFDTLVK